MRKINVKKSTVTERNIANIEENENCQAVSQVQNLLSNVEKTLSSVYVKMSCVNVETRKKFLPSVSQILYQVENIVSSSTLPLDTAADLWWDESGILLGESYGQDDSLLSDDVFLFPDAKSTKSSSPTRDTSVSSLSSRKSSTSSSSMDSSSSMSSTSNTSYLMCDLPAYNTRPHITSIAPDLEQLKTSITKSDIMSRNANAVIDNGCEELEESSSSRVSSMPSSSASSRASSGSSSSWNLPRSSKVKSSISSSSSDVSSDSNTFEWVYSDDEQDIRELEDEILFESILQAIDLVAPNNVFSRGKSERKRRKKTKKKLKAAITPHLLHIWQNVNDLVFPKPIVEIKEVASPYPIIDFSKVNKRALSSTPEPERFPVLGCSPDPKFYEKEYYKISELERFGLAKSSLPASDLKLLQNHRVPYSKHDKIYPFGSEFGFYTNLGIVDWSSRKEAVHGYIWSGNKWVLEAKRPQDKEKVNIKREGSSNFKKKIKRKKESR